MIFFAALILIRIWRSLKQKKTSNNKEQQPHKKKKKILSTTCDYYRYFSLVYYLLTNFLLTFRFVADNILQNQINTAADLPINAYVVIPSFHSASFSVRFLPIFPVSFPLVLFLLYVLCINASCHAIRDTISTSTGRVLAW